MDLPKRKKIRLEGYDYSSCGAYFITICVTNKNALLRNVGEDITRPHDPHTVGADTIRPRKHVAPQGQIPSARMTRTP